MYKAINKCPCKIGYDSIKHILRDLIKKLRDRKKCCTNRWPVNNYAYISDEYGWRILDGKSEWHPGIDIAASEGTPIYPFRVGVVTAINDEGSKGYGHSIQITHDDGTVSLYGHMNSAPSVALNQKVTTNTIIGYVGNTGLSTGYHLHFEVRDSNGSAQNPRDYFDDGNGVSAENCKGSLDRGYEEEKPTR